MASHWLSCDRLSSAGLLWGFGRRKQASLLPSVCAAMKWLVSTHKLSLFLLDLQLRTECQGVRAPPAELPSPILGRFPFINFHKDYHTVHFTSLISLSNFPVSGLQIEVSHKRIRKTKFCGSGCLRDLGRA